MNSPIQAVIFDWAGTIVDFGSFAPTSIFVEAFKQGFDFEISLAEAREPMGLGKWQHIEAVGQLPSVAQRWQNQFGRPMQASDIDAIYAAFMPLQIAKVADHAAPIPHSLEVVEQIRVARDQNRILLWLSTPSDGCVDRCGSRLRLSS